MLNRPDHRREQPKVVMLLANEFLHDTRVSKQARSLIKWGCEVHIVALARPGLAAFEVIDGIQVHRVTKSAGALRTIIAAVVFWWSVPILWWLFGPSSGARDRPGPIWTFVPAIGAAIVSFFRGVVWGGRGIGRVVASVMRVAGGVLVMARRATRRVADRAWALVGFLFVTRAMAAFGQVIARGGQPIVRSLRRLLRGLTITPPHRPWPLMGRLIRSGTLRLRRGLYSGGRAIRRRLPPAVRILGFNAHCVRKALDLKPDVIQSHDLNTLPAGTIVKRLLGTPLVYDSHELFLERNIGDQSRVLDKAVWAPIEWFCIRKCDAVFSVAASICMHLADRYRIPRPHLIRNVQPYEPPAARTRLLSDDLGLPYDQAVVLYPGAITFNRGLEILIDSAPYLDRAQYVIMGYARNPQYLESLKERARRLGELDKRVFFRDAVATDQVVRYTASADLGIVPTQNACLSYYFESSNKIFHCLMAGVPVVMSDHAEKRLLVEEHGIGALFDETDPRDIARVVNETLADRQEYERMRRRCLIAARILNWEREEHTLLKAFAGLLGDRAMPVPESVLQPVDLDIVVTSGKKAPLPVR